MTRTIPPGRSIIRWNILALLTAASFVAYLLRTNMSVAGEHMMGDLRLTQVQLGFVLAAFAWGYGIFQFPGGVFGDRIGARKTLAIIAVLWGVLNLMVGLIPDRGLGTTSATLAALVTLRALMGAAQAPLYPVTGGAMTCDWFPVAGWAFPNAMSNAGLTLGSAAAGPLIAWLMESYGWRQSFIFTAPLGFLLAGVWWWYARDTPAEHPAMHQGELDLINAGRPPRDTTIAKGDWKLVVRDPQVLLLTASYFCSNYVFYFFFNWLFIYLVDNRGFKTLESGFYSAAPWITGAVGAVIGGLVCDRLSRTKGLRFGCRAPAMVGLGLSGLLLLAAANAASPVVCVVLLSLCLACQQAAEGPFWAATIGVAGKHTSSACGVLNTGGNIVGGIGALMVPITVKLFGWPAALATGTAFALIGALLWLWIRADREFLAPA
ncbi:MAG: MFS transporter [Gemmatimonadota bacterium]